jgi:type I restriction enzyme, S subunit
MKTMLLGDIARIKQGYTFKPKYQGQQGKKWPYIKVADVGSPKNTKYLNVYLNSIDDQVFKEINVQPFESGSIVFPRVGAALRNNNKRLLVRDCLTDDNVICLSNCVKNINCRSAG